ncbi:phosphonate C-P lyase system protein PhnH [Gluconobacter sp. LMG 1744]|uniref:phosphonate C-P lyase system protein PhnH n=2 Tax=Gluconobacter TaxID=441 RepID=UPI0018854EB5|nr:phosphonate C-P lyase system protein PhnH [Gluconobacter cadivus]
MTVMFPGLRDSHEAQRTFRALLNALAHPGRPQTLPRPERMPEGYPASIIGLLSLLDATVTVGFPAVLADLERWLVFHTGTSVAPMERADFIYVPQGYARPPLASLRQGALDAPETSATLILEIPSFSAGNALELTGPGIQASEIIRPVLDCGLLSEWQRQSGLFPRGVDIFLLCGTDVIGLPRSTAIREV